MPHALSPEREPPSFNGEKLYVNDGLLRPEQVGALKPSSPDLPAEELRRRYNEDGYVFLKGLLPREDVLKAREEYFKMLAPTGVLKPGTEPVEGIFDDAQDKANYPGIGAGVSPENGRPSADLETAENFVDLALQAHHAHWYKDIFCKHPVLKDAIARISGFGDNTLAVQRSLLRNNTPGNKAIGVHYDQIFLRHGEDTSFTAWVSMGDISLTGGGLIYLEKSHTLGREIEADFTRKAKERGFSDEQTRSAYNQNMLSNGLLEEGPREYSEIFKRKWLVTTWEAGDVVLHTPYTIHASTLNFDPKNVIRLGTDLRFVDQSKPWDKRWDKVFESGDGL
ncbi:phytanoyl-CoA hydroxylase [Byssothecium circinans]|uniref:Phytanoyl-CoA hydroxylase n=1 Tax=Byssothecium circinans TaxID=147558 RepID=A0A6A5UBM4_9PLEO|nr:phytanoyl-CoA hydroxylase [Byssothecium circinans]